MTPNAITAIIAGILAGTALTQIDLNHIVDFCTPRMEGAIQWQEDTVKTYESLADTPEEIKNASAAREQWNGRRAVAEERLAGFQNLKIK